MNIRLCVCVRVGGRVRVHTIRVFVGVRVCTLPASLDPPDLPTTNPTRTGVVPLTGKLPSSPVQKWEEEGGIFTGRTYRLDAWGKRI